MTREQIEAHKKELEQMIKDIRSGAKSGDIKAIKKIIKKYERILSEG